jgi:hypothetical protein
VGRPRRHAEDTLSAPPVLGFAEIDAKTMFDSFDVDGSGALDPVEFAIFYKVS